MLVFYLSLFMLGLTEFDPIGLIAVPLILGQKNYYRRITAFLLGGFLSLMVMGLLFAKGLGKALISFEHSNSWFLPTIEYVAAVVLFIVAGVAYWSLKSGKLSIEPGKKTRQWLKLNAIHLFIIGFILVVGQSLIDVVYIIAMIKIGQFHISNFQLVGGITTYSFGALVVQLVIVIIFMLAPKDQRDKLLVKIKDTVIKYSYKIVVVISLILGLILLALAAGA